MSLPAFAPLKPEPLQLEALLQFVVQAPQSEALIAHWFAPHWSTCLLQEFAIVSPCGAVLFVHWRCGMRLNSSEVNTLRCVLFFALADSFLLLQSNVVLRLRLLDELPCDRMGDQMVAVCGCCCLSTTSFWRQTCCCCQAIFS